MVLSMEETLDVYPVSLAGSLGPVFWEAQGDWVVGLEYWGSPVLDVQYE